jgi:hypothetical protein
VSKLENFADFIKILIVSGFAVGGGNDEGIYAIVNYDSQSVPPGTPIIWHTATRKPTRGSGESAS